MHPVKTRHRPQYHFEKSDDDVKMYLVVSKEVELILDVGDNLGKYWSDCENSFSTYYFLILSVRKALDSFRP